jgi:F0F1-type ATP synthase assembly protein I
MTKNSQNNQEKDKKSLSSYGKYSSLTLQMMVIILLGLWGGMQLDKLFKFQKPVLTVILCILSFAIAMYLLFKDIIKPK